MNTAVLHSISPRSGGRRAFTLIELLVVVVILAILVGIALPVYSKVKAASARAISVHSLGQLMVGGRGYLNDNDNNFWPYQQAVPGGTMWWFGFETSASLSAGEGKRTVDYSKGPLGGYASASGGVQTDPAFLLNKPRLKPKYMNGNYGYGYNTVLSDGPGGQPRNAGQVSAASKLVVFATCAQVNGFQPPATAKKPMVEEFYMINETQTTAHFRHGKKALAVFFDGSVRELSMAEDMQPGSQDKRLLSAYIGRIKPAYLRQEGW